MGCGRFGVVTRVVRTVLRRFVSFIIEISERAVTRDDRVPDSVVLVGLSKGTVDAGGYALVRRSRPRRSLGQRRARDLGTAPRDRFDAMWLTSFVLRFLVPIRLAP